MEKYALVYKNFDWIWDGVALGALLGSQASVFEFLVTTVFAVIVGMFFALTFKVGNACAKFAYLFTCQYDIIHNTGCTKENT